MGTASNKLIKCGYCNRFNVTQSSDSDFPNLCEKCTRIFHSEYIDVFGEEDNTVFGTGISKAMIEPIRKALDYRSVGRKMLLVDGFIDKR